MTPEQVKAVSSPQLCDQWRAMELRKRYWNVEAHAGDSEAADKVVNYELLMKEIWDELEDRIDRLLPIQVVMSLIEDGFSFNTK